MPLEPVHRTLVTVDVEQYSSRLDLAQYDVRRSLRQLVADAFDRARLILPTTPDSSQDGGDALLLLLAPDVSKVQVVDVLPRCLLAELRRFNEQRTPEGRLRLRMAVHAGEVIIDGSGYAGRDVVTAVRLRDSAVAKQRLADSAGHLVLVVSNSIYRAVVEPQHGSLLRREFSEVDITEKCFQENAWLSVLGDDGERPPSPSRSLSTTPDPAPPDPLDTIGRLQSLGSGIVFGGPTSFGGHAAGRDVNVHGTADR